MREPVLIKIVKVKDVKNKDVYFYSYSNPNLKVTKLKYICLNNEVEKNSFINSLSKIDNKGNKVLIKTNEPEIMALELNVSAFKDDNLVPKYVKDEIKVNVLTNINFNKIDVKEINGLVGKIKQQINNNLDKNKHVGVNEIIEELKNKEEKFLQPIKEESQKKLMIYSEKIGEETKYYVSFLSKEVNKPKKRFFTNFKIANKQIENNDYHKKVLNSMLNISSIKSVKDLMFLGESKDYDEVLKLIEASFDIRNVSVAKEAKKNLTTKDLNGLKTYITHEKGKDNKIKDENEYTYKDIYFKMSGEDDKNIQFSLYIEGVNNKGNTLVKKNQTALIIVNKNNIDEDKINAIIKKKIRRILSFENMRLIDLNENINEDVDKFKSIISEKFNVSKHGKIKSISKEKIKSVNKIINFHTEDFYKKSVYLSEDKQPEKDELYIYSDASVFKEINDAVITYGIILRKPESDRVLMEKNGIKKLEVSSSNIAEAHGVYEALIEIKKLIKENKIPKEIKKIDLKLDNINVVYAVEEDSFKSKSFGSNSKEDVDNILSKIKDLKHDISKTHEIRLRWVEGHVKNVFNEMVDSLSNNAYSYKELMTNENNEFSKVDFYNEDWFEKPNKHRLENPKFKL